MIDLLIEKPTILPLRLIKVHSSIYPGADNPLVCLSHSSIDYPIYPCSMQESNEFSSFAETCWKMSAWQPWNIGIM